MYCVPIRQIALTLSPHSTTPTSSPTCLTRSHPCEDPREDVGIGVVECGLYVAVRATDVLCLLLRAVWFAKYCKSECRTHCEYEFVDSLIEYAALSHNCVSYTHTHTIDVTSWYQFRAFVVISTVSSVVRTTSSRPYHAALPQVTTQYTQLSLALRLGWGGGQLPSFLREVLLCSVMWWNGEITSTKEIWCHGDTRVYNRNYTAQKSRGASWHSSSYRRQERTGRDEILVDWRFKFDRSTSNGLTSLKCEFLCMYSLLCKGSSSISMHFGGAMGTRGLRSGTGHRKKIAGNVLKYALFDINQYTITKFSSQMSSYTHQKFRFGGSGGPDFWLGAVPPALPLEPPLLICSACNSCFLQIYRMRLVHDFKISSHFFFSKTPSRLIWCISSFQPIAEHVIKSEINLTNEL